MNKALAVMLAEEHATTEQIIWWLQERVALNPKIGGLNRSLFRRFLKEGRAKQENRFKATCRQTVTSES